MGPRRKASQAADGRGVPGPEGVFDFDEKAQEERQGLIWKACRGRLMKPMTFGLPVPFSESTSPPLKHTLPHVLRSPPLVSLLHVPPRRISDPLQSHTSLRDEELRVRPVSPVVVYPPFITISSRSKVSIFIHVPSRSFPNVPFLLSLKGGGESGSCFRTYVPLFDAISQSRPENPTSLIPSPTH